MHLKAGLRQTWDGSRSCSSPVSGGTKAGFFDPNRPSKDAVVFSKWFYREEERVKGKALHLEEMGI